MNIVDEYRSKWLAFDRAAPDSIEEDDLGRELFALWFKMTPDERDEASANKQSHPGL